MKKIALFTLALLACGSPPSTTEDETERVIAEVAASREAARLAVPTQQSLSIPCPPQICQPDIVKADYLYPCAMHYPWYYQLCGTDPGRTCGEGDYENLVPPTSGMVRYFFRGAASYYGVCFEIDTYRQGGRVGIPNLGQTAIGNGITLNLNDATGDVRVRTPILHATGATWEHHTYNLYTPGQSTGQNVNEHNFHSIGIPGWISSAAAFYKP